MHPSATARRAARRRASLAVGALAAIAAAGVAWRATSAAARSHAERASAAVSPAPDAAAPSLWSAAWDDSLQAGDLVFRRGESIASRVVLRMDEQSAYSHVGIVVMHDGRPMVAHAVPEGEDQGARNGMRLDRLEHFLGRSMATRGAVVRRSGITAADRARISAAALALVEAALPFDAAYQLSDPHRLYCTEFVWRVFDDAGVPIVAALTSVSLPFVREPVLLPSGLLQADGLVPLFTLPTTPPL